MNTSTKIQEELFPIPNFSNYLISKSSKVYSTKSNIFLKPATDKRGYKWVSVVRDNDNKRLSIQVHQLMAITFLDHTPCGNDLVVDHINSNKSDNRLENLRVVTQRENNQKERVGTGKSKYIGITWHKRSKVWQSQIGFKRKKLYLGSFKSEEEAAYRYQVALDVITQIEDILRESA